VTIGIAYHGSVDLGRFDDVVLLVRGTNTGPGVNGSELTGRTMTLQGAPIIQLEGVKIRSDKCYFDRKALDKQFEPN
jgi:hypothetical protein